MYSSPIVDLQANGYLPSGGAQKIHLEIMSRIFQIIVKISTNSSSLRVNTNVPTDAQPIIENSLPAASVDLSEVA